MLRNVQVPCIYGRRRVEDSSGIWTAAAAGKQMTSQEEDRDDECKSTSIYRTRVVTGQRTALMAHCITVKDVVSLLVMIDVFMTKIHEKQTRHTGRIELHQYS